MKRAIIFGAGGTGRRIYHQIKDEVDVVAFVDSDQDKWGNSYDSIKISNLQYLQETGNYDEIYLGTLMGLSEVQEELKKLEIPVSRLNKTYVEISVNARIQFLNRFAELVYQEGLSGSVAEAGVYRGEFAKEINGSFPDRRCYLFDTFEGFDKRDFTYEKESSMTYDVQHLTRTNENIVMSKMPYPEQVSIKKGWFPETTNGIEDEFVFVNLDMDLYKPTIEGLRFFFPRLNAGGGVLLVHDYYSEIYPNIKRAIDDYEKEIGMRLHKAPIGDDISLAIVK